MYLEVRNGFNLIKKNFVLIYCSACKRIYIAETLYRCEAITINTLYCTTLKERKAKIVTNKSKLLNKYLQRTHATYCLCFR